MNDFPELPTFCRIPQADRREAWKGVKLTKPRALATAPKVIGPDTIRLIAEIAAAEKAKEKAKAAARKEAAIIRKKQRGIKR